MQIIIDFGVIFYGGQVVGGVWVENKGMLIGKLIVFVMNVDWILFVGYCQDGGEVVVGVAKLEMVVFLFEFFVG